VGTNDVDESPLISKSSLHSFRALQDIDLRESPHANAKTTGNVSKGTIFRGHMIVTHCADGKRLLWDHLQTDETCFIHLGEKMGWALSRNPVTNEALVGSCDAEDTGSGRGWRQMLATYFTGRPYDCFITIVALLNFVVMCWQIERQGIQSLVNGSFLYVTTCFLFVYVLDALLKQVVLGVTKYFSSSWNTLDFSATLVAVLALLLGRDRTGTRGLCAMIPAFRLLRLVGTSSELGRIAKFFAPRLRSLLWAAGLTALWLLVNSVVCMAFLGHHVMLPDEFMPAASDIRQKFDSLPKSCLSLLRVLDWPNIIVPIAQRAPVVVLVLFGHLAVTAAALFGMWLAVTVEKDFGSQNSDRTRGVLGHSRRERGSGIGDFRTGRVAQHWPARPKRPSRAPSLRPGSGTPISGKPSSGKPGSAKGVPAKSVSAKLGLARPGPSRLGSGQAVTTKPSPSKGMLSASQCRGSSARSPLSGPGRPRLAGPTRPGSSRPALAGSGSARLGRLTSAPSAGPARPR